MVSRDLRRIKTVKSVHGPNFNPSVAAARYSKEQDVKNAEIAKRTKEASKNTRAINEKAINEKGLKVGDRVTDGYQTGKIRSFDPKTKVALVFNGRRETSISPTVLRLV